MYRFIMLLACCWLTATPLSGQEATPPLLQPRTRVAIAGDSLTQQALYSRMIEVYLHACVPQLEAAVLQLGWSGERLSGFNRRLSNDLLFWSPTLVLTAYGINDGGFQPFSEQTGARYREELLTTISKLREARVDLLLGTPGVVDSYHYQRDPEAAATYNQTLHRLAEITREVAAEEAVPVAPLHEQLRQTMSEAKAVIGDSYPVAGTDGIHPLPNGHLIIAYTFLRAMGLDGEIGTFTVDWDSSTASASSGHRVVSFVNGDLTLESRRYPFCFTGSPVSPNGTVSILPYLPFNRDLNRLTLILDNLPSEKATVRWGREERQFTRQELAQGINLAAHFQINPFQARFQQLDLAVAAKQRFEITMIKELIHNMPELEQRRPEDTALRDALLILRERLLDEQERLTLRMRELVQPLTHTITIVPLPSSD